MSTEFYQNNKTVGVRSGSGVFCYRCGITLYKGFNPHYGNSLSDEWYDKCPRCGDEYSDPKHGRRGVHLSTSFTWLVPPNSIDFKGTFTDEYGRVYSIEEFDEVVRDCALIFYIDERKI